MSEDTIKIEGKKPICVSFNAPISNATSAPLMGALANACNDGHDEIHLMLSTPGGSVADGITLYNFIHALSVPVVAYNIGSVNSIGNIVYQAASRKLSSTVSSFMFHGVGVDINQARFELKHLRERTQQIESDQAMMAEIMVRHTQLGTDDINKLFLEMAFLSAQEALERGITDEVTDIRLPDGLPILQLIFKG